MNEDHVLPFTCIVALAVCILTLIVSVWHSSYNTDAVFERLVKSGRDPVQMACAQRVASSNVNQFCIDYAMKLQAAGAHDGR